MINEIIQGDCLEVMKSISDNSIDGVVTDPPYGISFMGKKWDYNVPSIEVWEEVLRVLKPGGHDDSGGSASRFFYCAKASTKERNVGLNDLPRKKKVFNGQSSQSSKEMKDVEKRFTTSPRQNNHPTVKPLALMEYLVKLISPPGEIVILDPFIGSGTTAIACINTGRRFIGIEKEAEYVEIARKRISKVQMKMF